MVGATIASMIEQYQLPVFAYLARLVGDREWGETLAEEVFRATLRTGHQLPAIPRRRAWLYRIATDIALKALKRRQRIAWLQRAKRPDRQMSAAEGGAGIPRPDAVEQALAALPPEQRAALLLYSHHELSLAEVAEVIGIEEGAAMVRLYSARTLFRQAYERAVQNDRPR
jgi:RNA polymerase sigma-70 factor (ECF subfamily)